MTSFVTFALGEGMAKKVDNFAEEVAAMAQNSTLKGSQTGAAYLHLSLRNLL